MNLAVTFAGATVRTAAAISPQWGAVVAMPMFGHVDRPRPVHPDDEPTIRRSRRRTVPIAGLGRRGVDVVTYEWGRGPRTVLVAHGWNGRASQFATLVRELVAEGCRVVSFDAPAHGESGGRGTYLVDWLDAFTALEERHGRFDAIVGHSFGGLAALVGVARGLSADRVVTVAAPADADLLLAQFQGMLRYPESVTTEMRRLFASRYFPGDPDPYVWLSAVRRPLRAGTPLLVVHDEGDRMVPFAEASRIARANPGARTLATTGFGHNRVLSADAVLDAVLEFLDVDLPPAGVETSSAGDTVPVR